MTFLRDAATKRYPPIESSTCASCHVDYHDGIFGTETVITSYSIHYTKLYDIPLAIVMLITFLVHVGVAIAFGYTWIF